MAVIHDLSDKMIGSGREVCLMDLGNIKLIIWDLDETFWHGILSDGNVQMIDAHIDLIKNIVDSGVMCSICSKNDENKVREILEKYCLFDYFVFNSINWSPKGDRVKQIISEMGLRESNVLFLDDNPLNRAEVKKSCPQIFVEDEKYTEVMIKYFTDIPHKDIHHERLNQYKLLERKKEFKAQIGSNEEFLLESHIVVEILEDCENHIDRIVDILLRTNQLNFTKVRSSKEEVEQLIRDQSVKTAYVRVKDSFGDYGIVGFFAIKEHRCIHFAFSCRVLNMGIEQYVYRELNEPFIDINGEVSSDLNTPIPYWINQDNQAQKILINQTHTSGKLLLKGPCDMSQISAYMKNDDLIETEFTYINQNGVSIEGRNHTWHILQSLTISPEEIKKQAETIPFGDYEMYTTAMFDEDIKFVFFSLFTDPILGLYRDKGSGTIVAFGEYTNDLTDENRWNEYIDKKVFVANCNFTEESLHYIKEHYTFEGRITHQQILKNLKKILSQMNRDSILILNLGSEMPYMQNAQEAYEDRHIYNRELNKMIKQWALTENRVRYIDINEFITGQNCFIDNINHFVRKIYFEESKKLISMVEAESNLRIRQLSKIQTDFTRTIKRIQHIPQKIKHSFIFKEK